LCPSAIFHPDEIGHPVLVLILVLSSLLSRTFLQLPARMPCLRRSPTGFYMDTLLQDLKFSLRLLAKSPGFTAAAVGLLALGIGLNTGMFTFIYTLAFSPRPFADPARIVQLYTQDRQQPDQYRIFSYPLWRNSPAAATSSPACWPSITPLSATRRARKLAGPSPQSSVVTIFDTLGVQLARGRTFTAAEEQPGAARSVVIVSHTHWAQDQLRPGLARPHATHQRTALHRRGHRSRGLQWHHGTGPVRNSISRWASSNRWKTTASARSAAPSTAPMPTTSSSSPGSRQESRVGLGPGRA
jgi:hypothetical protein